MYAYMGIEFACSPIDLLDLGTIPTVWYIFTYIQTCFSDHVY
jgi:hypothetical protein